MTARILHLRENSYPFASLGEPFPCGAPSGEGLRWTSVPAAALADAYVPGMTLPLDWTDRAICVGCASHFGRGLYLEARGKGVVLPDGYRVRVLVVPPCICSEGGPCPAHPS